MRGQMRAVLDQTRIEKQSLVFNDAHQSENEDQFPQVDGVQYEPSMRQHGFLKVSTTRRRYRRIIGTVDGRRTAGRRSSTAPKKKVFDRGGLVWPPRSNAKVNLSGEKSRGGFAPQLKTDSPGFLKTN